MRTVNIPRVSRASYSLRACHTADNDRDDTSSPDASGRFTKRRPTAGAISFVQTLLGNLGVAVGWLPAAPLVGLLVWVLAYGAITRSMCIALVLLVVSRLFWREGIRYDSGALA